MSYVVHLWKHQAPASMDDALRLHEELLHLVPQPSHEPFALLLQRLARLFPQQVGGRAGGGPTWVVPAPPVADL